jgi:hypothetical protein
MNNSLDDLQKQINCLEGVFGLDNLPSIIERVEIMLSSGCDYFPNYAFPGSWNEWATYINFVYYQRSPLIWQLRHKLLAKNYTREKVGDKYVVKTYAVYDKIDDIDIDALPNSFVIKAVIGGMGRQVLIVKNKLKITQSELLKKLASFDFSHWKDSFQRLTKNRFIAEEYLEDANENGINDFKFFCSMGCVICCRVHETNKQDCLESDAKSMSFYSVPDWNFIPARQNIIGENIDKSHAINMNIKRPEKLDEMLKLAEKLAKELPLARIDLYDCNSRVLVGEITISPGHGCAPIKPAKYDFEFGSHVKFPEHKILEEWIRRDIEKYGIPNDFL